MYIQIMPIGNQLGQFVKITNKNIGGLVWDFHLTISL